MLRERVLLRTLHLIGIILLSWSIQAEARQTSLTGTIGTGYTFWDRSYDDESSMEGDNLGDRREWRVWPEFELQSLGIHDSLIFHYSPVLSYEELDDETDVDHFLNVSWLQQVSKKWSYEISDDFVFANNATLYGSAFESADGEVPDDEITQNLGKVRYWTNNLGFLTTYSYAQESRTEFGYTYRILRNDSASSDMLQYDEYDRHGLTGLWSHRYTPAWGTQIGVNYYKGIFEELDASGLSQDLQEYRIDLQINYATRVNNVFPLIYRYQRAQYENIREDIWGHELSLNWDYTFDTRTNLLLGAGPSYVQSEDLDGDVGYNFIINFTKTYQHGNLGIVINKHYLTRNFTGAADTGLSDITDVRVDAGFQMTPDLELEVFGLYRYEEILNPQGEYYTTALGGRDPASEQNIGDVTYTRKGYSAGVSVNYSFWSWLVTSLSYVYYDQEGDVSADSFNDHRIILQLRATTELWR